MFKKSLLAITIACSLGSNLFGMMNEQQVADFIKARVRRATNAPAPAPEIRHRRVLSQEAQEELGDYASQNYIPALELLQQKPKTLLQRSWETTKNLGSKALTFAKKTFTKAKPVITSPIVLKTADIAASIIALVNLESIINNTQNKLAIKSSWFTGYRLLSGLGYNGLKLTYKLLCKISFFNNLVQKIKNSKAGEISGGLTQIISEEIDKHPTFKKVFSAIINTARIATFTY